MLAAMEFVETSIFTKQIQDLVDDDVYRALQASSAIDPKAGVVIRDSGGLRKIRLAARGKGKRGGARVIYFHLESRNQIAMLLACGKDEQDDLTADQRAALHKIVQNWSAR